MTTTRRTAWNETTVTGRLIDLRSTPNGRVLTAIVAPVGGDSVSSYIVDDATAERLNEVFWSTLDEPVVTFSGRYRKTASSVEALESLSWVI